MNPKKSIILYVGIIDTRTTQSHTIFLLFGGSIFLSLSLALTTLLSIHNKNHFALGREVVEKFFEWT